MSRTLFVNPALFSNPRRKKGKKSKRRHGKNRRKGARYSMRGRVTLARRRNAGIAPFVQNPLILSNPVKRRRRRRANPMSLPSMTQAINFGLSAVGGATGAVALNTMGLSHIGNAWGRRASQAGAAIVGGAMAARQSQTLGAAFAGAMLVPLIQDLSATFLGIGGAVPKDADLDALAADLEDVLDDMDPEAAEDDEDAF